MTYYIDTNKDNVIIDCISTPKTGYIMVNIDLWRFKYKQIHNGCYVFDETNNKVVLSTVLEEAYLIEQEYLESLEEEVYTYEELLD